MQSCLKLNNINPNIMAWKFEYYKPFFLVFFSCNSTSGKRKLKPNFIDTPSNFVIEIETWVRESTERPVLPLAPWLAEDIGHPPFRGKGTSVYTTTICTEEVLKVERAS